MFQKKDIIIGMQFEVYKILTFSHMKTFLFRLYVFVKYKITFKAI